MSLFFLLFVLSFTASARDFIVAVDHFPPWKIVSSNEKEFSGVEIKMIEKIISEYNSRYSPKLHLKYISCPWQRCLNLLKKGKADLVSGVLKSPEREGFLYFLEPAYKEKSTKAFYVKKSKKIKIDSFNDLYGKVIGTVTGVNFFDKFDSDSRLIKMAALNSSQNLNMLDRERFDVIIGTEGQLDYLIEKNQLSSSIVKTSYKFDKKTDVFFALSKKSPHAGSAIRLGWTISRLKRQGFFRKMADSIIK